MNNQYITESIFARQAGGNSKLSEAELRDITEREHHLHVIIADRQRQLDGVIEMQEWYRQNTDIAHLLEDTTNHHNIVNKQYLALRSEETKLAKFDSVQEFRSPYERINEVRRIIDAIMLSESATAQEKDATRQRLADTEREAAVAAERLQESEDRLEGCMAIAARGFQNEGEMTTLAADLIAAEDALAEAQRLTSESEADYQGRQKELAQVKQQLETLNLHHQALAVHQQLFQQFQAVKEKLTLYNTESDANERVHQDYVANNSRLSQLTVSHDKSKKLLQSREECLDALLADRNVHIAALDETDSASLYHRYAQSQQRLVLLESARSAWQTIAAGYDSIEEQRAAIERMKRHVDQKMAEKDVAERDVRRLYERLSRLNKAYILLQIDDTRKMRESLREGVPCPVCGSAHHPYHTEVEQELGTTQSQLEKDFHDAQKEYQEGQRAAADITAEAQEKAGQLEAERLVLERMLAQQQIVVDDWERYRQLDSTFSVCSPSVNRDARRATIEMLIDSTDRNVKECERLIASFDFHNEQLSVIAKNVEAVESEVDNLRQQFWTLDTQLQLLHERVDTLRTLMTESDARLEQLYKDLDDVVTVSGWRDEALDTFAKSLSELYLDWTTTTANLQRTQHEYDILQLRLAHADAHRIEAVRRTGSCREERDRLRELVAAKREELRKEFGEMSPADYTTGLVRAFDSALAVNKAKTEALADVANGLAALDGRAQALADFHQQLNDDKRELSTLLDHAVARYNMVNPAIQTSELTALFSDNRDWNLLRHTVADCRDALIVARTLMNDAERRHMAHQALPCRPSKTKDEDRAEGLSQRRTALVLEIDALRGELADIRRILDRHNSK